MNMRYGVMAAWLAGSLALFADGTGTDPANKYAWSENTGWVNAAPSGGGIAVHFDGDAGWLSGYAWGENIGWIKLGADAGGPYINTSAQNWGVNMSATGTLAGYAWGENVGWINFGPAHGGVEIDPAIGLFSGHAWGENIGWLLFSGSDPSFGVRTLAFDLQPMGTPNWWLDNYGVSETHDAGDGVLAWRKFVMDTDPTVAGSYLRVVAVTRTAGGTAVTFEPSSARRYYTLARKEDLQSSEWLSVPGQSGVMGTGSDQTLADDSTPVRAFYKVMVTLAP